MSLEPGSSTGSHTSGPSSQYHAPNNISACSSPTNQLLRHSQKPSCYSNTALHNSIPVLHKDEHVYFDDGNVVLVAGTTCFRVHRSLLAKHSSIFRDMFNIPQPEAQDIYEGVPKVELQDDPDILRALLRVIYEPFSSPLKTWLTQPTVQTTTEMVGAMGLALKYEVDSLRNEIVHQLSSAWPRTMEDWDILEKKREMFGSDMPRLDPAAAIRMARIADMPEVLPLAYYCTIQVYPSRPIAGDTESVEESKDQTDSQNSVMTSLLDRQDLAALALGRESMAIWVSQHARSKFRTWNCHSSTNSRGLVCSQRIHLRWAEVLEDVTMRRDVLEVLKEHASWGTGTFGSILCSPCQGVYVEIMRQMRKDFFKDLPRIFGLGQPLRQ